VKETIVNQASALAIAMSISLVLSTVLMGAIRKPLRGILNHLCPGSDATAFWLSFTTVMLYVTPLMFALMSGNSGASIELVTLARSALAASLFGSFAALLVVGYQIARARPRPQ
jgi:hypothetical protein